MEPTKQELPPPYSATGYDNNFGASAPSAAPTWVPPLDNLSQVLGGHVQLNFYSTNRIGFGTSTLMVQLQDPNGQPVMSTLYTPGPIVSHGGGNNEHATRGGGTTKFMDSTGKALLTAQEHGRSWTISSGDTILGVVEGFGIFAQNIMAKNVMGQVIFRVVREHNQFNFYLANGTQVGKITRNSQAMTSLSFSQSLDPQTKALVLATAYVLYLNHYASTMFGAGRMGLQKKFCFIGIIMLCIPIIMFIIFYVSLT